MTLDLKLTLNDTYIENFKIVILRPETVALYNYFIFNSSGLRRFQKKYKKIIEDSIINQIYYCSNLKIPIIKKINLFVEFLNKLGFGKLSLIKYSKEKCIFKVENILLLSYYHDYSFEQIYLLLFLKKFLKLNCKKTFKFTKETSVSKNEVILIFKRIEEESFKVNTEIKKNNLDLLVNVNTFVLRENLYEFNYKKMLNSFSKKILFNKMIKNRSGRLALWNKCLVLIPKESINIKPKYLNLELKAILFTIGFYQGRKALSQMKLFFGKNSVMKIMKNIATQSELVGFGEIKILDFDFVLRKIKLEYSKSFFEKRRKPFGLFYYSIGLSIGVLNDFFNSYFSFIIEKDYVLLFEIKFLFLKEKNSMENYYLNTNYNKQTFIENLLFDKLIFNSCYERSKKINLNNNVE